VPKPTTLPTWDTTAVNITTPVGEQSVGWGTDQAPSAQVFNWLHYWTYRWAEYINSAIGMAADAWAWTGRHSFIRAHASESAVEISNTGGGQALVVTGPSTTGSLDSTSIDADSVATRSLSAIAASGTAATITNSDPGSTAPALVVTHAGGLQRALDVIGDEVVDGYLSATKSIACTAGGVSATGTVSGASGSFTGAVGCAGVNTSGNVSMTGPNTAQDAAILNKVTPDNVVKAYGTITVTVGGVAIVTGGLNVASVGFTGNTQCQVTLASPMANTDSVVTTEWAKYGWWLQVGGYFEPTMLHGTAVSNSVIEFGIHPRNNETPISWQDGRARVFRFVVYGRQ